MSEETTTETSTVNETFSTSASEQQAPEKTTEEQFYGSTEETTEVEENVETTPASEKPEGEEVTEAESVKDETEETSKEETEEWSLELPEESFVTEEGLKEIESFAKENNLNKEAAEALMARENKAVEDYIKAQVKAEDAEIEQWRQSVINDPNLGGENLKKTVESARRVVERFGSEEFVAILNETGYGDNPEVVKFLSKIGGLMSEDSLVTPQARSQNKEKPLEEYFYGTNNN